MALAAYMEIKDIKGGTTRSGKEDMVEVIAFDHTVDVPTDINTGQPTGARVHREFQILKTYDKASVLLYKYLCENKIITEASLHWYHTTPEGKEEEYYTMKIENASVVKIHPHMMNTDDDQYRKLRHQEWVSFRYQKITWTYKDGNIEYTDDWKA
jgi:type VI secretion system secreted protein Hcp